MEKTLIEVTRTMCGGGGPMNLTLDEVTWERYLCDGCGKTFLSMAKRPRCPACGSEEIKKRTPVDVPRE